MSNPRVGLDEPTTKRQESTVRRILRGPAVWLLVVIGALWLFLSLATRQPEPRKLSLTEYERIIQTTTQAATAA